MTKTLWQIGIALGRVMGARRRVDSLLRNEVVTQKDVEALADELAETEKLLALISESLFPPEAAK